MGHAAHRIAERMASMKWLEGWFGVASGVLGIVWVAIMSLLTPTTVQSGYGSSQTCMASSDGVTKCYSSDGAMAPVTPAASGVNVGLLILFALILVLFVGMIIGTILDLRGARTAGRIILLASATLLIFIPFTTVAAVNFPVGAIAAYTFPLSLMSLVAGVLACVRRDTPRAAASPAQG
jgi:hypothetical protein